MAKLKYKMIELKEAGHPTFIKKSWLNRYIGDMLIYSTLMMSI